MLSGVGILYASDIDDLMLGASIICSTSFPILMSVYLCLIFIQGSLIYQPLDNLFQGNIIIGDVAEVLMIGTPQVGVPLLG